MNCTILQIKLLLAIAFALFSTNSYSQELEKFRIGIGLGGSFTSSNFIDKKPGGGILIFSEPSYQIKDRINVGIRFEYNLSTTSVASYGINGQYYFSNKNFRPFAGVGLGFYHPMLIGDGFYGYTSRLEKTVLGFYPRVGFDWHHLTLALEWNVAALSKTTIYPSYYSKLPAYTGYLNSNYLSFKAIIFIGGERKRVK